MSFEHNNGEYKNPTVDELESVTDDERIRDFVENQGNKENLENGIDVYDEYLEKRESFLERASNFANTEIDAIKGYLNQQKKKIKKSSVQSWLLLGFISVTSSVLVSGSEKISDIEAEGEFLRNLDNQIVDIQNIEDESSQEFEESKLRDLIDNDEVLSVLKNIDSWKNQDFAGNLLLEIVNKYPWESTVYLSHIQGESYEGKVVDAFINADSSYALNMIFEDIEEGDYQYTERVTLQTMINNQLSISDDNEVVFLRNIIESNLSKDEKRDATKVLEYAVNLDLSVEEASQIVMDEHKYWDTQVEMIRLGGVHEKMSKSERLEATAEARIKSMNYKDHGRFNDVKDASISELYSTIAYGGDRGRPSVVRPLFRRLYRQMRKDGKTALELSQYMEDVAFSDFMKIAAEQNKLVKFLEMSENIDEKEQVLRLLLDNIESQDIDNSLSSIAQVITRTHNKEITLLLQKILSEKYTESLQNNDKEMEAFYGLLSKLYEDDAIWLGENADKYEVPVENVLEVKELLDENNISTQMYYVYNDSDGYYAFLDLVNEHKSQGGWEINDMGTFLELEKENDGRTVAMYINKPFASTVGKWSEILHNAQDVDVLLKKIGSSHGIADIPNDAWERGDLDGVYDMTQYAESKGLSPSVQIHRGHVYYNDYTMGQLTQDTRLYLDGSCGGGSSIPEALRLAPNAQIIANIDEGRTEVNRTIMLLVNDRILSGKDIVWHDLRKDAKKIVLSKHDRNDAEDYQEAASVFREYVFPNEDASRALVMESIFNDLIVKL